MKKQLFILSILLLTATSGFAQFTLNVTVPSTTDTCFINGSFDSWAALTPLHYVSTSVDGTTKLFSSSTLPLTFAGAKSFYVENGPFSWATSSAPVSFTSVATGVTSQDVTVTGWKNVMNYTFINVTVPLAVSECYFIGQEVGWTLPTNAKKMILSATNTNTKVFSYTLAGSNPAHPFTGLFYAGLDGALGTYRQLTPYGNFTNPGTGNIVNFTVSAFSAIYAPVTTAVETEMIDNALVKVIDKSIVAERVASNISIFDVRGSLIQSVNTKGLFTSKALNSGLYIIRVDNKAYKQVIN